MLIVAVASRLRVFQASPRAMVGRVLHTCSSPTSRRLTAAAAVATATSCAAQRQVAACMPCYPFTAGELDESKTLIELCMHLDDVDDSDVELAEDLLLMAAERCSVAPSRRLALRSSASSGCVVRLRSAAQMAMTRLRLCTTVSDFV